jgi:dethiobiotin synthase
MRPLIVTGTDTEAGKTVVAAMLTLVLDAVYWKPIQAGTEHGTDRGRVEAMTGLAPAHFIAERYMLREPLSPHRAAELDGLEIDLDGLAFPSDIGFRQFLIVEGAGGVLVPITRSLLQADLFRLWGAPAIVVARTTLGTINHTLLTVEALRRRSVDLVGIVFSGESMPDTERTIIEFSGVDRLGRVPVLPVLDAANLRAAFDANFDRRDFEAIGER